MHPAAETHAVRAGNLIFASGQLASDSVSGVAPEARIDPAFPYYGSAIKKQTRTILQKLAKAFEAQGTSLDHCIKAHVFHTDLRNFDAFDEVWREFFPKTPPCRATVGMAGLPVPGCLLQVDLTATMPSVPARVFTSSAPRAPVNYSEVMTVGDLVFAAGLMASDYKTGVPAEAANGRPVSARSTNKRGSVRRRTCNEVGCQFMINTKISQLFEIINFQHEQEQ